ncbi:MAG TPA: helix-turn-helix domain-containing protein [Halobacteriales archaeon]|nr:helix-turn-helix domain-containing protein [Halobacteriales archaeon]
MLIVEARIDSPILREALRDAPGTTVVHEELYDVDDEIRHFFWAEGDDFDAFDAGLDADPTVTDPTVLTETGGRRLYRVTFTEAGEEVATFPTWGELDLVMLDSRATADGWQVRIRVPDRNALSGFVDACRDRGLTFVVDAIYSATDEAGAPGGPLTAVQREALLAALETGYFDVPRSASLEEIAARLEVSPQAASERLRRGMAALVDARLRDEL